MQPVGTNDLPDRPSTGALYRAVFIAHPHALVRSGVHACLPAALALDPWQPTSSLREALALAPPGVRTLVVGQVRHPRLDVRAIRCRATSIDIVALLDGDDPKLTRACRRAGALAVLGLRGEPPFFQDELRRSLGLGSDLPALARKLAASSTCDVTEHDLVIFGLLVRGFGLKQIAAELAEPVVQLIARLRPIRRAVQDLPPAMRLDPLTLVTCLRRIEQEASDYWSLRRRGAARGRPASAGAPSRTVASASLAARGSAPLVPGSGY